MEQYLKQFANHAAYQAAESSLDTPNVSYCVQEGELHYNSQTADPTLLYLRYDQTNDKYIIVDYLGKLLKDSSSNTYLFRVDNTRGYRTYDYIASIDPTEISYYTNLWGTSDLTISCTSHDSESSQPPYEWYDSWWTFSGTTYHAGIFLSDVES
jgi:hypothetical protein